MLEGRCPHDSVVTTPATAARATSTRSAASRRTRPRDRPSWRRRPRRRRRRRPPRPTATPERRGGRIQVPREIAARSRSPTRTGRRLRRGGDRCDVDDRAAEPRAWLARGRDAVLACVAEVDEAEPLRVALLRASGTPTRWGSSQRYRVALRGLPGVRRSQNARSGSRWRGPASLRAEGARVDGVAARRAGGARAGPIRRRGG
jgi:hypothetical protein